MAGAYFSLTVTLTKGAINYSIMQSEKDTCLITERNYTHVVSLCEELTLMIIYTFLCLQALMNVGYEHII